MVKEGRGCISDARPKLAALLADQNIGLVVVEHKARLMRFGTRCPDTLLTTQRRTHEVVNQVESGTEVLLADLTAIV